MINNCKIIGHSDCSVFIETSGTVATLWQRNKQDTDRNKIKNSSNVIKKRVFEVM